MSQYLAPVIAASAEWLARTYAATSTPVLSVWAGIQARQATTIAAWLRYPTVVDAALVALAGPGGAGRLDALVAAVPEPVEPWRTWVDEVVVSWAACLLTDAEVARDAVAAVVTTEHAAGLALDFGPLLHPDAIDARAAALLRHPDLVRPVADLYRAELLARVRDGDASSTVTGP